jgi:hypothetical protein
MTNNNYFHGQVKGIVRPLKFQKQAFPFLGAVITTHLMSMAHQFAFLAAAPANTELNESTGFLGGMGFF